MGIGEIIAIVAVCIVAIGLVATWKRNGSDQTTRDIIQAENMATWKQEIRDDIEHVQEELKSEDHGLLALAQGQADFRENCARLSTGLAGKVETNSSGIKELKASKGRK